MLLKIMHVGQETNKQTNQEFLSWSKNFPNGMGPESSLPHLCEPHYQPAHTLPCIPRSSKLLLSLEVFVPKFVYI
jgi:hypothetical protein